MYTELDNQQRTFLVRSDSIFLRQENTFCNLADIPKVLSYYKDFQNNTIFEFFNGKLKFCSKTHLNEMFAAHKIDYQFQW